MPEPESPCRCEELGHPLARFCPDDLFCPQCGGEVGWLVSDNLQPSPDGGKPCFWVYAEVDALGRASFPLSLEFRSLDAGRQVRTRPLGLDPASCKLQIPNFFEEEIEFDLGTASRRTLRLRSVPEVEENMPIGLPRGGVAGQLLLMGDCGRKTFEIRAFNAPDYRIEVEGEGKSIQSDPINAPRPTSWTLWRPGVQELTIRIEPLAARVYLPSPGLDPSEVAVARFGEDSGRFRLLSSPALPMVIGPGEPAEVIISIDSTRWVKSEAKVLILQLGASLPGPFHRELTLSRQAQGNLEFETGPEIQLRGPLFYKERVESGSPPAPLPDVAVRNVGEGVLRVRRPRLAEKSGPPGVDWIKAAWLGDDDEAVTTLETDAARTLRISLDLSKITPDNHSPGVPLKATIRFDHDEEGKSWTLDVVVPEVRARPPLSSPLAVDFGNTNTFAAYVDVEGDGRTHPALGQGDDPETFPSALYFADLSDPLAPACLIGKPALARGAERPGLLVRGLKRELTDHRADFEQERFVFLWDGDEVRYSLRQLVGFFLVEVIRASEARLRRTVTRLGLSYPANFGPISRARLDSVIGDLESRWRRDYPEHVVQFDRLISDEASSVALGFVFDGEAYRSRIKPALDGAGGGSAFTVASFDFGGGSIDCALIRFEFTGTSKILEYRSQPLGIGGNENFGGDTLTVAAAELLAMKLSAAIGEATPRVIPLARPGRLRMEAESLEHWDNAQVLWEAAESAKRFAMIAEPTEADRVGLRKALADLAGRLKVAPSGSGLGRPIPLASDPKASTSVASAIEADRLTLKAEEIYDHAIARDLSGGGGYKVRDRIEAAVAKLGGFVEAAADPVEASPRFVVLAGAGCRVPLAREALAKAFPLASIVEDPERAKSKVASGLVRYLDLAERYPDRVIGLAMARDYSHAAILWLPGVAEPPEVWIPSCTPLTDGPWFDLPDVPLSYCWDSSKTRVITVYRDTAPPPQRIGEFRLSEPASVEADGVEPALPEGFTAAEARMAIVGLRIDGDEESLLLRVRLPGREFGHWEIVPEKG